MIKPISYARQMTTLKDMVAVSMVVRSSHLAMGPQRNFLEKELQQFVGAEFALATSSGTAALHAAYASLSIQPGDEIIVPAITFAATATAAMHRGAVIRFADVNPESGLIDVNSVGELMNSRTLAVVGVDYAGQPCDIPAMKKLASGRGVSVLADSAHSLGSMLNGVPVGNIADVTCFSMFATKNIAAGEGGAVVTNSRSTIQSAKKFVSHGIDRDKASDQTDENEPWRYDVESLGLNYRPSEMQSALARSQLSQISKFRSRRQRVFERYVDGLSDLDDVELPVSPAGAEVMWHLFPIRVPAAQRLKLFHYLHNRGVIVQVNYIPVYYHSLFSRTAYPRGLCPGAEQFYSQEISLPMHAGLSIREQARVIKVVRSFFANEPREQVTIS